MQECSAFARAAGMEVPQGGGSGEFGSAAAACQQRGIPLDQCQTFCQSNPTACGFSTGGGPSQGGMPAVCAGVTSREQCEAICQSNPSACGGQGGPGGQQGQYQMPAACAGMSQEQCNSLCQSNPVACGYSPQQGGGPEGECPPGAGCGQQQPPTGDQQQAPQPAPNPEPAPAPAPVSGAITYIVNSIRGFLGS